MIRVLSILLDGEQYSLKELAQITSYSASTVEFYIKKLIRLGVRLNKVGGYRVTNIESSEKVLKRLLKGRSIENKIIKSGVIDLENITAIMEQNNGMELEKTKAINFICNKLSCKEREKEVIKYYNQWRRKYMLTT